MGSEKKPPPSHTRDPNAPVDRRDALDPSAEANPLARAQALAPSPFPRDRDGREIDPSLGVLSGEGAGQRVRERSLARGTRELVSELPSTFPAEETPTYYGQPALKPNVWEWYIPAYFYVGGAAGALGVLGASAGIFGRGELDGLRKRAKWIALGGEVASAALLIADLGRPERFLNMMRVFRPTSPMNMGTWVLAGSGAATSVALLLGEKRPGVRGTLRQAQRERSGVAHVAELAGGVFGLPLAGYTAVLLANTAVPAWQLANRTLPWLFMASSAASAASLLQLVRLSPREQTVVNRFATIGRAAELVAADAVERSLRRSPSAAKPLHEGQAGRLWTASKVLTAASLGLTLFGGKRRWAQVASGLLGTAGALALRFAVVEAGKQSAVDPKATFEHQRAGLGAAEVTGPTKDPKTGEVISFRLPVVR